MKNIPQNINDIYPFSQADRIQLYSYRSKYKLFNEWYSTGINLASIKNDTFKVHEVFEIKKLNQKQKKELFAIIIEKKKIKDTTQVLFDDGVMCYYPRHSIVFSRGNKAIAFLEVCFQCGGHRSNFKVDEICYEKKIMLEKFFLKCGIKRGFSYKDDRFPEEYFYLVWNYKIQPMVKKILSWVLKK